MNFYEFLNTRNSNNSRASHTLNESVNFKADDLAFTRMINMVRFVVDNCLTKF